MWTLFSSTGYLNKINQLDIVAIIIPPNLLVNVPELQTTFGQIAGNGKRD
jgi:hypothetical protein